MRVSDLLIVMAAAVAVSAAVRSTWSPCGLSMLSSITPFAERARGHRYWLTATWFVLGATVGGATLGTGAFLLALVASALGANTHSHAVLALVAAACIAGAAVDARVFGEVIPVIRRQVDDRWLSRYRSWFYAAGFGWQIGVGLATYVMTAGVFVLVFIGALSGRPIAALLVVTGFGAVRGLAVLLASLASTPAGLRSLHAKLDRAAEPVRWAAIGVQVSVGAVAAGRYDPAAGAAVGAAAFLVGLLAARGRTLTRLARR